MKKVWVILSLVTLIVACGSNDANQDSGNNTNAGTEQSGGGNTPMGTEPAVVDLSSNPDYQAGLAIEAKSDCATCHKLDEKLVGPSFRDIANKYPNDDATITMLAGKVINGGAGNWGQVPMTPHPQLSQDDAKTIVKYILLLKK
jgi:cytochrome c